MRLYSPEKKSARQLLHGLVDIDKNEDVEINGASLDSRCIRQNELFFAFDGAKHRGIDFIDDAVARGASLVLFESGADTRYQQNDTLCIGIDNLIKKLPSLLHRLFDDRINLLTLLAVTGTNGKTTCAHLLAQAFIIDGRSAAYMGTIGWGLPGELHESDLTTPDIVELYRRLFCLACNGVQLVCFEVSSHAIAQDRIAGLKIDTAVLTNISHDHLDYHVSMTDYAATKHSLFARPGLKIAVVNGGDEFHQQLVARVGANRLLTYGQSATNDVQLIGSTATDNGLSLEINVQARRLILETCLLGEVNIDNILAVVSVLVWHGIDLQAVASIIIQLVAVPGRMERFSSSGSGPLVVVDYAHTPDALHKSLLSLRVHTGGRLWCVFGCGGDRDCAKRGKMGHIAERVADEVVLTDDNPRFEAADKIVGEIEQGMHERHLVIHDRRKAIHWTIGQASANDTVLIAGKGDEKTQIVGDQKIPMNDREIVSQALGQVA